MTRFLIHVIFLFILGCGAIRSSAALSLDDKVKELESRLENKIIQLEEKVTQLETQLEQNVSFYLVSKEVFFLFSLLLSWLKFNLFTPESRQRRIGCASCWTEEQSSPTRNDFICSVEWEERTESIVDSFKWFNQHTSIRSGYKWTAIFMWGSQDNWPHPEWFLFRYRK